MDDRRELHELLQYSEAGKRLMENADYKLLIREFEKELAGLWKQLRETPTTDPQIAKIQGQLDQLDEMIGRAREWIERATDFVTTTTQKPKPDLDDFNVG
ncbi:MAG: hypothetical protein ACYTBJ_23530 [Planctomycetota bacterium]|jgi:hypothetical protein